MKDSKSVAKIDSIESDSLEARLKEVSFKTKGNEKKDKNFKLSKKTKKFLKKGY